MNMHARIAERTDGAMLAPFARTAQERPRRNRFAGLLGVVAIHALLAAAYVFGAPAFYKPAEPHQFTVVSLPPEKTPPPPPPPVMPKFDPPPVFVPTAIMPEVELVTPPPPPVITVPQNMPPSPPTAEMGPPPPPKPAPTISSDARAAFASRLFTHLNRYKRYPEGAKLRHQIGRAHV